MQPASSQRIGSCHAPAVHGALRTVLFLRGTVPESAPKPSVSHRLRSVVPPLRRENTPPDTLANPIQLLERAAIPITWLENLAPIYSRFAPAQLKTCDTEHSAMLLESAEDSRVACNRMEILGSGPIIEPAAQSFQPSGTTP